MANARALDNRRKSVKNIKKITRTMELIATARFKQAMDRATAATGYTQRITQIVNDLAKSGLEVSHPLLEKREETKAATLLVLTSNRGLCGGYNGNVLRSAVDRKTELEKSSGSLDLQVSGKRGLAGLKFRGIEVSNSYTHFEDKPSFAEVSEVANGFLDAYIAGTIDRLDVVYTQFVSVSKQRSVVETLLPLDSIGDVSESDDSKPTQESVYEFVPSPKSILEEVVPTSFKVKLFKCFLDAAVSEQIARMIAMKSATENASEMIKQLSMEYNRARQSQITGEIMEIIGGVEALEG
ncbi:ATP synthase F1 subunit gamma [Pirellulaceae bacterium]|jgi:F-type H+-transporting ATPase subunit gamma|nr:ATP synthase F1 subunit gamma [Pirellulaceae bacterium]MDB4640147.1 ATP synthase F1 subunit gamma [Pirellulaceae bacterium]